MLHEIIRKRRSTVLFSSKPIDNEILIELFEAARWAPSSNNLQPWRFIYAVKDDSYYNKFLDCLNERNQTWASRAPVLLITVAQTLTDDNRENIYASHDTGMAYSNLVFQLISHDLFIHPMGGFNREKARLMSEIPANYEPIIMAALGYLSESSDFDPILIEKEKRQRIRKPLTEIAFHGRFGSPFTD
jgi:nitroreductase